MPLRRLAVSVTLCSWAWQGKESAYACLQAFNCIHFQFSFTWVVVNRGGVTSSVCMPVSRPKGSRPPGGAPWGRHPAWAARASIPRDGRRESSTHWQCVGSRCGTASNNIVYDGTPAALLRASIRDHATGKSFYTLPMRGIAVRYSVQQHGLRRGRCR